MKRSAPFAFVELPEARSQEKPRKSGITMMADFGVPIGYAADVLGLAGRYLDLAKIAIGTSRLYEPDYLKKKLALYRRHAVRTFIGGQFQEYVFATHGAAMLPRFWAEARRVGFRATEVSDNCVPLSPKERKAQIRGAIAAGLAVLGEVGSKSTTQSGDALAGQAEDCFEAGAEIVLVEAAELVTGGKPNAKTIATLERRLDMSRVLIELPNTRISGITLSMVEDMKRFLIRELGPDVNLGNVMPTDLLDLEALRVGLGVTGPKMRKKRRA